MTTTKEIIELNKVFVSLNQQNIIKILVKDNIELNVEDILAIQKAKHKLIENQKHYVLFVTPRYSSITPEARSFSASAEVNKNAIAKGIVVVNLATRLISQFFVTVNKPPVMTKIFATQEEALSWFKTIKE